MKVQRISLIFPGLVRLQSEQLYLEYQVIQGVWVEYAGYQLA